jgi:hypothetical protein
LLNTDELVAAFGFRCSRRLTLVAFASDDDSVGAALERVTAPSNKSESRDADIDRLRDYSARYPVLDDTSVRDYYRATAVNLALMSIVNDGTWGLQSRARRIMHTAMGAWHELGYLIALRTGVQGATISGFADEVCGMETEQQCIDVTNLSDQEGGTSST